MLVSLTSVPPRFKHLENFLRTLPSTYHIHLTVPSNYSRFPEKNEQLPESVCKLCHVHVCDEDIGPATKIFPVALSCDPEQIIVYIDDDTLYTSQIFEGLLQAHNSDDKSAWGTSGFSLDSYFRGEYPRRHGMYVDVIEGYGAVIVKAGWMQKIYKEFLELRDEAKFADDLIISNLLEKIGVPRRTVCTPDCNVGLIQQYTYGFEQDSLHRQTNGGHHENYGNIIKVLEARNKMYLKKKNAC